MNRTTIIRALDIIAIFLAAHIVIYGFTGLALWDVNMGFGRASVLILIHVVGLFAPWIARDFCQR